MCACKMTLISRCWLISFFTWFIKKEYQVRRMGEHTVAFNKLLRMKNYDKLKFNFVSVRNVSSLHNDI